MATATLDDARLNVARGRKHLDELYALVEDYWYNRPFQVLGEDDPETGDRIYRAKVNIEVPREWATTVGDIIHNLRTALDYIVTQLVLSNGGTPTKRHQFPITSSDQDFDDAKGHMLKDVSSTAIERIRQFQPYKSSIKMIEILHSLDIVDKHRLILAVGAMYKGVSLLPSRGENPLFHVLILPSTDPLFPLADGALVHSVRADQRDIPPFVNETNGFLIELAFGDAKMVTPMTTTLEMQFNLVSQIIDKMEPLL